jgi:hypothetical protein
VLSQLGPLGFILIGSPNPPMVHQHTGSLTRYPKFWGKGDEDVEQHWFLCEAIWWSRGTLDANKLVEFQTTLRGRALKWYMKSIKPGNPQGKPFPLPQVKQKFIVEFKLPQSEQQALSELWEIKQRDGESSWEYNQRFKDVIGKLANPIHEDHQWEWFIQGLLPLTWIPLTQQWITTLGEALEQAMKIEVMVGYPGSLRVIRPPNDYNIMQLQGHISSLTDKIQELTIPRESHPQVWCTGFYTEGHTMTECPRLRGAGPPCNPWCLHQ